MSFMTLAKKEKRKKKRKKKNNGNNNKKITFLFSFYKHKSIC